jgi:putative ABC transport system permease protein
MFDRGAAFVNRRDVTTYEALLRLAPGVTLDQARAAVEATSRRLAVDHRATNADRSLRLASLKDEVIAPVRRPLRLVALASIITVLIAFANATILALMRASDRAPEMAIRQALGASLMRLHRQILVESLLVATMGCLGGVLASRPILTAILRNDVLRIPRADAIAITGAGVLYGIAIALSIAAVLALVPLGLSHAGLLLRAGARVSRRRLRVSRQVTISAELALALVLCSAGALLGLSLARVLGVDPGFDPRSTLAVRVSAYAARYPTLETVQSFFTSIERFLESMPDVESAAAGSSLPLSGQTSGTGVLAEGSPDAAASRLTAGWQYVTPGYFAALRIPMRSGRDFIQADNRHSGHVTIINEDLARRLFGGESAIGKRIGVGGGEAAGDWHEIIGVVADVHHSGLDTTATPRVYDLFGEHWGRTMYVVVRSKMGDPSVLIGQTRRAIRAIDSEAPVFDATTVDALVARSAGPRRIAAILAGSLAGTALLLALVAVYAVSAASVAERTKEIAIRAALGASPRDVIRMLAHEGAASAIAGGAIGTAASIGMARVIASQLFGVRPADIALVIAAACLALAAAAAVAALPAGRRAATADPVLAMRAE